VVRGDPERAVSPLLRRILWHQALRDDRVARGHGSGGFPDLAVGRDRKRIPRVGRGETVRTARVQHVPPAGFPRPGPQPGRVVRHQGDAPGRPHRRRRRELHPRVDRDAQYEGRRRISTDHAHLPGPDQRGGTPAARRLREVAVEDGADSATSEVRSRRRQRPHPRPPLPEGEGATFGGRVPPCTPHYNPDA
jgi:hypothetical protein